MIEHLHNPGIELRDWFAGLAMHAIVSNTDVANGCDAEAKREDLPMQQVVSECAYAIADHMLVAATTELEEGEPELN